MIEEIELPDSIGKRNEKEEQSFSDLIRKYQRKGYKTRESIEKAYSAHYNELGAKNKEKKKNKKDIQGEPICH